MINEIIIFSVLILSLVALTQMSFSLGTQASVLFLVFIYFLFFTILGRSLIGISLISNIDINDNLGRSIKVSDNKEEILYIKDDYYFAGTGFFINNNDVVTNNHVMHGCKMPQVKIGKSTYRAYPIAATKKRGFFDSWIFSSTLGIDWGADLAVLRTNSNGKEGFVPIRSNHGIIGEQVQIPNFNLKKLGYFDFKFGEIKNSTKLLINASIKAISGNSGSPLLSYDNLLIGVLSSARMKGFSQDSSISTNSLVLSKFLEQQKIPFKVAKSGQFKITRTPVVSVLCHK